tara:strand:- start:2088 stop:4892 length:2805 start_codon:yes stop_codon:yes gene_type:complete
MINEFYKKVLPTEGVYCIATIKDRVKHYFVESVEEIEPKVEELKSKEDQNIYIALGSFDGYSRKADNALYFKSLFIDLDVGEEKDYSSKQEAEEALDKFMEENNFPLALKLDSGRGIHAYWILNEQISKSQYVSYSEKLRDYCLDKGLRIDRAVMADPARIMRCPNTLNMKDNPPTQTKLISREIPTYDIEDFKTYLGEVKTSLDNILIEAKGPLTEDQKSILKLDNFQSNFKTIAIKSLKDKGCGHIKQMITDPNNIPEPLWYAGLSIAQHCDDRNTAIHNLSEGHRDYNKEVTERKANQTQDKPQSCKIFNELVAGICDKCEHQGKITNPLALGKEFKPAPPTQELITSTKTGLIGLPKDLGPFRYGKNGGIYFQPPVVYDEDGNAQAKDPILVSTYDLYPIKRIYSVHDGECLLMKVHLPNDPEREFMLPVKYIYALDKFREIITSVGILYNPNNQQGKYLMTYLYEWGQYLITKNKAEIMRMQMGWTPKKEAFVIGSQEITKKGEILNSPTSPLCKGIAKHLSPVGSYDAWKDAVDKLNTPSLELHAFTLLAGLGSVLMNRTPTSGVTISLTGDSGSGKTGALYGSLSVWGNPKDLSVLESTENGMTGRYLALHNLPFGLDEVGNTHGRILSQLIHKISQGKSKIRMQASINAEREHEMSASLIAIFTSNHSLYDKLSTIKKDPNGEVARLIEFSMRKPQLFIDKPSSGIEIFNTFRTNYGWAGSDFIQNLFKYSETELISLTDKWTKKFKEDFGDDTVYRFYESLIVATFTAGEIALKANIVRLDLDRIYKRVVGEMINIRDNVIRINSVDYESVLGEYINAHQTGILALENNQVTMEPRSNLVVRADLDKALIYIEKKHFRTYLTENGVSTNEFMFQMKEKGYTIKNKKLRMGTGWKPATGFSPVTAIEIDTTKFLDDLLKEQNSEST